jgi:hypothetical protein
VIGAGEIVRNAHLPAVLALPDARVDWVVDRDERKARLLARSFGVGHVPLPSDLAALPAAAVVLIAVPYGVREPMYEALSSRSALYVEKPGKRLVSLVDAAAPLGAGAPSTATAVRQLLHERLGPHGHNFAVTGTGRESARATAQTRTP